MERLPPAASTTDPASGPPLDGRAGSALVHGQPSASGGAPRAASQGAAGPYSATGQGHPQPSRAEVRLPICICASASACSRLPRVYRASNSGGATRTTGDPPPHSRSTTQQAGRPVVTDPRGPPPRDATRARAGWWRTRSTWRRRSTGTGTPWPGRRPRRSTTPPPCSAPTRTGRSACPPSSATRRRGSARARAGRLQPPVSRVGR
jgi:hypothetical protein